MNLHPNEYYRRAFKRGMSGWDVAALQIALNSHRGGADLVVDGFFGRDTERAVLDEQGNHHLVKDGIAGLATQTAICEAEARRGETESRAPTGMLKGLIEGESGYAIACTTPRYGNGTRDMGPLQYNTPENDQIRIRKAFNLRAVCLETARGLREDHDAFYGSPGAATHRKAWEMAILNHNWPAATKQLVNGTFDSWRYYATDEYGNTRQYGVDDSAHWIRRIGAEGVETARQWVKHYVQTKTVYVTW